MKIKSFSSYGEDRLKVLLHDFEGNDGTDEYNGKIFDAIEVIILFFLGAIHTRLTSILRKRKSGFSSKPKRGL